MNMTNGLQTYSSSNLNFGSKDISVNMTKVENGYIVTLNGSKGVKLKDEKGKEYDSWERINTQFVFNDLQSAINDLEGFFKLLENWSKK
jgi:hypothetical protein